MPKYWVHQYGNCSPYRALTVVSLLHKHTPFFNSFPNKTELKITIPANSALSLAGDISQTSGRNFLVILRKQTKGEKVNRSTKRTNKYLAAQKKRGANSFLVVALLLVLLLFFCSRFCCYFCLCVYCL